MPVKHRHSLALRHSERSEAKWAEKTFGRTENCWRSRRVEHDDVPVSHIRTKLATDDRDSRWR